MALSRANSIAISRQGSRLKSASDGVRRRRINVKDKRKASDDEFLAASIGDLAWLKQSLFDFIPGSPLRLDKNGLSSLHLSAMHGHLDCMKFLVEDLQCDVNTPSSSGWRPIHLAINKDTGKRAFGGLMYLLQHGAMSSVPNDDNFTPVHQAATEGHVQCLQYLIDMRADIRQKDCRGHTPLELARLWGHRRCARILATALWTCSKNDVAKEIKRLKNLKQAQMKHDIETLYQDKLQKDVANNSAFRKWLHQKLNYPVPVTLEEVEEGARRKMRSSCQTPPQIEDTIEQEVKRKNIMYKQFRNTNQWNFSPKIPPVGYISELEDDFPRDIFTKMPRIKNALKYFDGKFRNVTWTEVDEDFNDDNDSNIDDFDDYKEDVLKSVKLPKADVRDILDKDPTRTQRPVVFKTSHINDIGSLKKFSDDETVRSEAGLTLCPDQKSFVFQGSLQQGISNQKYVQKDCEKTTSEMMANFALFERPQFIYDEYRRIALRGRGCEESTETKSYLSVKDSDVSQSERSVRNCQS